MFKGRYPSCQVNIRLEGRREEGERTSQLLLHAAAEGDSHQGHIFVNIHFTVLEGLELGLAMVTAVTPIGSKITAFPSKNCYIEACAVPKKSHMGRGNRKWHLLFDGRSKRPEK
jgi:hypothetical protein